MQIQELDRKGYSGPKPPLYLTNLIDATAGFNMYDDPHFRLVWAEARLTPSGGTWLDWLPNTSMADRNTAKGKRPWRRSAGIRMIKRYGPAKGWVLERWVPPSAYGSREQWYSPAVIGGTIVLVNGGRERLPSQGSYPSRGEYEYTGFCYETSQLAESTVLPAVQALIRGREEMPQDPARRVALRSQIARAANEEAERIAEQGDLDMIENMQPAFSGQIMSGYGKKGSHSMNAIAKRLGITSHTGRS